MPENAENDNAEPVADAGSREFWLSLGSKMIGGRFTRIDAAAEKLVAAVAWFWTAYTASALVGISLAGRELEVWRLVLAALPSVVLIAAYLTATNALMPIFLEFDPRAPDDIRSAHDTIQAKKEDRLRAAKGITAVGAALVAVAIVVVASAPAAEADSFSARLESQTDGSGQIQFAGRIGQGGPIGVTVEVTAVEAPPGAAVPEPMMVMTDESGEFSGLFPEVTPGSYEVQASWSIEEQRRTTSVVVKPE
jgi:hypothetical protein